MSLICQLTSEDTKQQYLPRDTPAGEIKRSRGGWGSWTFKLAGRWSWAAKVGLLSLRAVPQQQCNGHCPCDCPARQLKQQLRSALVAGQWRGDTALTLPLFWRRSTVSPVFFRAVSAVEPSLFRPLPPLSPSLISNLASVDVKQNVLTHTLAAEGEYTAVYDSAVEGGRTAV